MRLTNEPWPKTLKNDYQRCLNEVVTSMELKDNGETKGIHLLAKVQRLLMKLTNEPVFRGVHK
jgi:hypothetical protein